MKKALTVILLFTLAFSMLLCSCDMNNSKKEEEDEVIKKIEIRQNGDAVTVVYEDGYELIHSLTQPIEPFVEKDNARSARAVGSSVFFFTSNGATVTITPGSNTVGTGEYYAGSTGDGNYIVSGDGFVGNVSGVQVQNAALYFEHNGKKYENCSSELLAIFRANTTLIDFVTGYKKEPFDSIYANGFTKFEKLEAIILSTSIKKVDKKAFDSCAKLTTVYYLGTPEEWEKVELVGTEIKDKDGKETVQSVENLLATCTVYFYSEEAPTGTDNYWHLVDGKPTMW